MSSTMEIIMWIGVFIATAIVFGWMFLNIKDVSIHHSGGARDDIKAYVNIVSDMCHIDTYAYNYTGIRDDSIVQIGNIQICIEQRGITTCKHLPCQTNIEKNITVSEYDLLEFTKDSTGVMKVQHWPAS